MQKSTGKWIIIHITAFYSKEQISDIFYDLNFFKIKQQSYSTEFGHMNAVTLGSNDKINESYAFNLIATTT